MRPSVQLKFTTNNHLQLLQQVLSRLLCYFRCYKRNSKCNSSSSKTNNFLARVFKERLSYCGRYKEVRPIHFNNLNLLMDLNLRIILLVNLNSLIKISHRKVLMLKETWEILGLVKVSILEGAKDFFR